MRNVAVLAKFDKNATAVIFIPVKEIDFDMQTMNISLPDPMKQYVGQQVNAGGYSSISEYVRVRADQKQKDREQLEKRLLESLNAGEPIDITPEIVEGLRRRLRAHAEALHSASR